MAQRKPGLECQACFAIFYKSKQRFNKQWEGWRGGAPSISARVELQERAAVQEGTGDRTKGPCRAQGTVSTSKPGSSPTSLSHSQIGETGLIPMGKADTS